MATEILHFEKGSATYHNGNYKDYYDLHHRKPVEMKPEPKPRTVKAMPKARPAKVKVRKVEEVEAEIANCELQLTELADRLSSPAQGWVPEDYAEIGRRQEELQKQLESLYREWEEVTIESNSSQ